MYWTVLCLTFLTGSLAAPQTDAVPNTLSPSEVLQSYPSIVQVEFYSGGSVPWSNECAGSVLTTRYILSAARCFFGWSYRPQARRIRAGSSRRYAGGLIFYVEDRINHPDKNQPHHHDGDVSVVRLQSPLVYSPVIRQAALAAPGSIIPDFLALQQLGFGHFEQPFLSKMPIYTVARRRCDSIADPSPLLDSTVDILCALPFYVTAISNAEMGSPWFFGNVTVGISGVVNLREEYRGQLAAPVAPYTEWIIKVVAEGF